MDRKILEKEEARIERAIDKKENKNQKGERKMRKQGILLVVLAIMLASGNLWAQKLTLIHYLQIFTFILQ